MPLILDEIRQFFGFNLQKYMTQGGFMLLMHKISETDNLLISGI